MNVEYHKFTFNSIKIASERLWMYFERVTETKTGLRAIHEQRGVPFDG